MKLADELGLDDRHLQARWPCRPFDSAPPTPFWTPSALHDDVVVETRRLRPSMSAQQKQGARSARKGLGERGGGQGVRRLRRGWREGSWRGVPGADRRYI